MSAPPHRSAKFPGEAWWRRKLRALGKYLKRVERSGAKNGARAAQDSPKEER